MKRSLFPSAQPPHWADTSTDPPVQSSQSPLYLRRAIKSKPHLQVRLMWVETFSQQVLYVYCVTSVFFSVSQLHLSGGVKRLGNKTQIHHVVKTRSFIVDSIQRFMPCRGVQPYSLMLSGMWSLLYRYLSLFLYNAVSCFSC